MAQETLGELGGTLATFTYVFLGYTSMVAYSSKSGQILCRLVGLPQSISGFLFTGFFTILISIGGTRATDQVNQWLTASMIGKNYGSRFGICIGNVRFKSSSVIVSQKTKKMYSKCSTGRKYFCCPLCGNCSAL